MDRDALLRAFHETVAAMRTGAVGSELQSTYDDRHRIVRAKTFWGDPLDVVLPELVACELDRYGLIEPGVTRLIIDEVRPGATMLDIGAHMGYFSLLGSTLGADVHAFEPSAGTIPLLERNIGGRARLVRKGVWHESGRLELKDFGPRHSALNTFLNPKDDSLDDPARRSVVEVTTIDDYCGSQGLAPDLIKIDTEGAERHVLEGGRRTIERHRPIVTVEVGDAPGTPPSRDALEFGLSLGYEPYEATAEGRAPHALQDAYPYGNIVLLPGPR
jgi:FkbM family methyltransferase